MSQEQTPEQADVNAESELQEEVVVETTEEAAEVTVEETAENAELQDQEDTESEEEAEVSAQGESEANDSAGSNAEDSESESDAAEPQDAYASDEHEAVEIAKPEPLEPEKLQRVIEGALLAAGQPLNAAKVLTLFEKSEAPSKEEIQDAFEAIAANCEGRGFELKQVASGWRFQVREETATWVNRLFDEKPQKYSRALLETLALIAYRQPITRGDIEEIRGVAVSSHIIKTLSERDWIKVVGHRDVPGRPSLYATTRQFLDYFNLKSLEELPSLGEISDLENLNPELELEEMPAVPETPDLPVDVDEQEDTEIPAAEGEEASTDEAGEEQAGEVESIAEDSNDAEVDTNADAVSDEEISEEAESAELTEESEIESDTDTEAEPAAEIGTASDTAFDTASEDVAEEESVIKDESDLEDESSHEEVSAVETEQEPQAPVEDSGITYQAGEGSSVSSLFDSSPEEEV